jgi:predicted AAA+ superfamily ATPase
MIEALKATYFRLLDELEIKTFRYIYDSFSIDNERLTGLVGPRGVGKTTLLLQYIKNKIANPQDAFYFSADHIYFNKNTLLEFITCLYEEEDIKLYFIDEIHKYPNWRQELKNIYDSFPQIQIVFSGSSSLDLVQGSYDLSRRAVIHYMRGLSFREYLNFATNANHRPISFADIISDPAAAADHVAGIPKLKGHFKMYLKQGYYPFVFEDSGHYFSKLETVINKTIYEDIANFYNLKTQNLHYFKKILSFLATIPPGTTSVNNLAGNLRIDSKTVLHYLHILASTGLVRILNGPQRGAKLLRATEKVFLENTTLLHAICDALGQNVDVGTVRELAFVMFASNSGETVFCRKSGGDFTITNAGSRTAKETVFEVGGRNKTNKQIRQTGKESFIVKDDILRGGKKTIPLYLLGFLY